MRSPEDLGPRDIVEPKQEKDALRYELVIRHFERPFRKHRLVVRFYEDGRQKDWVCFVAGSPLPLEKES